MEDEEEIKSRNPTKAFKEQGEMVCGTLETDTAQHRLYLNGACCRLGIGELEGILRHYLLYVSSPGQDHVHTLKCC